MNILKRKTEARDDSVKFDSVCVSETYAELAEAILAELEIMDDRFRYELTKIETDSFDINKPETDIINGGAYFGFGVDKKSTSAVIRFDPNFSVFVADANFGDVDLKSIPSKIKSTATDKLTLILLNDFSNIIHKSISQFHANLNHCVKDTALDVFYFGEGEAKFNRLNFEFLLKEAPKQKSAKGKPSTLMLTVSLILPVTLISQMIDAHAVASTQAETTDFSIEEMQAFWAQRIDHSHTRLKLVLEEFDMSVAECTRLQIGDVLPLPSVSLMDLRLLADFNDKEMSIANAALGIHKTHRAARLISNLDPAFLEGVEDLNYGLG